MQSKVKPGFLILILGIFAECSFAIFLLSEINKFNHRVLGTSNIIRIDKSKVDYHKSSNLKYFYEPVSNSIDTATNNSKYHAVNTINLDDLNERFDYQVNKKENTFRIITIGDSFTYGLNVDTKNNWPEKLEDLLNQKLKCVNFEVINLGVYGYDLRYALERYRNRGVKYNPDLVIWLVVSWTRMDEEIIPRHKKYLDAAGYNVDTDSENPIIHTAWDSIEKDLIKNLGIESILNYQLNNISGLRTVYKNKLIIAPLPDMEENIRMARKLNNWNNLIFRDDLINILKYKKTIIENDGHPNEYGHTLIAEDMFEFLKNKKIVPCI